MCNVLSILASKILAQCLSLNKQFPLILRCYKRLCNFTELLELQRRIKRFKNKPNKKCSRTWGVICTRTHWIRGSGLPVSTFPEKLHQYLSLYSHKNTNLVLTPQECRSLLGGKTQQEYSRHHSASSAGHRVPASHRDAPQERQIDLAVPSQQRQTC